MYKYRENCPAGYLSLAELAWYMSTHITQETHPDTLKTTVAAMKVARDAAVAITRSRWSEVYACSYKMYKMNNFLLMQHEYDIFVNMFKSKMPEFNRFVQLYFIMMDYIQSSDHISTTVLNAIHEGNLTKEMCSGIPTRDNEELLGFLHELLYLSSEDTVTSEYLTQAIHTLTHPYSLKDFCKTTGEDYTTAFSSNDE